MAVFSLSQQQREQARDLLPAALAGAIAWIVFILLGQTPLVRASGLALVIVGMAMALRPMGGALSIIGGLALAFSPAFWAQTGGAESLDPLEVSLALALALVGFLATAAFARYIFLRGRDGGPP